MLKALLLLQCMSEGCKCGAKTSRHMLTNSHLDHPPPTARVNTILLLAIQKKCLYEKQSFLLLLRFCSANFLLKLNFWTKNDDF